MAPPDPSTDPPDIDVLVLGAGVSGLSCAEMLRRQGRRVTVLDQGRGVGGRCATWRGPADLPLDYGVTFLHGDDDEFLDAVRQLDGSALLPGWPARVEGRGAPCQTTSFAPREQRFAVAEGISAWPKHLARGLDVRLRTQVRSVRTVEGGIELGTEDGQTMTAHDAVFTLPCEQARALLEAWADRPSALDGVLHLLGLLGTVPCLTLMAVYPQTVAAPPWDMMLPEGSDVLKLVSHESSKRPGSPGCALVLQARAAWSRQRLDAPEPEWTAELLAETAHELGAWAASPSWTRAHRWRYARTDLSSELAGPFVAELGGGARVAVAGELFARGAGVEAAWLSGRAAARALCTKEAP